MNSCNVVVDKITFWNWLYVNFIFNIDNALLAYSPLAMRPYCLASQTIRWVELESLSIVWWVCCVAHSLFQIIFVCPLQSRLPLNAKHLWKLSANMSVTPPFPRMKYQPPRALELKSEPSTSFAEALLSVFVPFFFSLGFSGQITLNCLNVSSGMA